MSLNCFLVVTEGDMFVSKGIVNVESVNVITNTQLFSQLVSTLK